MVSIEVKQGAVGIPYVRSDNSAGESGRAQFQRHSEERNNLPGIYTYVGNGRTNRNVY